MQFIHGLVVGAENTRQTSSTETKKNTDTECEESSAVQRCLRRQSKKRRSRI
jgi:hypothetical protein